MTAPQILPPQRAGVYRSPADAASVVARVAAAGGRGVSVDLAGVRGKAALLEALARPFALPASFGANWDALADSLQDLPLAPRGLALHLQHVASARHALGDEWLTFLEILQDTSSYWKDHGRAFVVFADDADELPPWV